MADVINFFHSLFTFRNLAPLRVTTQEINLALALKREAKKFAAQADDERQSGATAQELTLEDGDLNRRRSFVKIAVWHYERAAAKYRQAANSFDEAARVQLNKAKAFNLMNREMTNRAERAEAAVKSLTDFLGQN